MSQAKPGRRGDIDVDVETSQRDPVGNQSYPAKRAGSWNRVLRGAGVTQAAKRTQGFRRPRD